ncbi:MAG TPA: bile acid:sodium symporter [Burkholderiales bacterium]|nr:bile acid:sodium symporter [Burkholderiales bacterium]
MQLLSKAVPFAMLAFVVSSMLAMGLSLTVEQILRPLRNARLVSLTLLANFVMMPLGAIALSRVLHLEQGPGAGLLVLGAAAGAPFLPKLASVAKANQAVAVGLMVLLMVLTVGYMPLVLPLLLTGVSVDVARIARSLILLMLLPLGVGLAAKARYSTVAAALKPTLDRVANLSLILVISLITITNLDKVVAVFGTGGILAGILFIAWGVAVGYLLGGPDRDTRWVLGLGTSQRNIAAALVVGGQNFTDPQVVVMITVVALVGLLILMALSRFLSTRRAGTS